MQSQTNRPPRFWPFVVTAFGVLLLLGNFRLIEFDLRYLWPLFLIALGGQLLWRGDIGFTWQGQTFGITRGSVDEAALEADAGEIDVKLRALHKVGRLVAGQYTARSRPRLDVQQHTATVQMRRAETWLLSLAGWEVGLAQDVTWRLLLSAHLGAIEADLRMLEIEEARIATGLGDIRVVCPDRAAGPIWIRSTLGNITVEVPEGMPTSVHVRTTPLVRVKAAERFKQTEAGLWQTAGDAEALSVEVVAVTGDIHLI